MTSDVLVWGLILHFVGDYLFQSHWMATEKTKRMPPAILHGLTYGAGFLALTRSPAALAVIAGTHILIDRYRLARHVIWAKNLISPRGHNPPWADCKATGYPPDTPVWLAVGLLIAADNTIHILINTAALAWLR
jgi:hypothetical protein